ncbi:hypothetical protein A2625_01155 [candidate division WOR-1 bacterium RIFCSPHIGHO2_01_FULL_53_15]|uniref:Uncharacterized protein n=1 Tax=candidate division WOR-1 bacterium RIFCSPHIGHO2_01_FULL_53_15 TaxID=1802564 RepID=A0A1F4Q0V5_UNCSA|nr:MAG: hypothetical protein A2625_01155 [candidate division WOR-1 bacterium RIFCSPHIGHO2_01_FULL_53_15]OGC10756.1 MAG: hypothetical protein A3D23_04665 [candidate division WOR-1 bacterium RIFCSPHIGHO2_02_FULL_53_26]
MVIKSILREELENSSRLKQEYERALKKLPQGALVSKTINGHKYYYLVRRAGRKVKYEYKGKVSGAVKRKYEEAKKLRAKYIGLLARVKKQIAFLRSALRGKEEI